MSTNRRESMHKSHSMPDNFGCKGTKNFQLEKMVSAKKVL